MADTKYSMLNSSERGYRIPQDEIINDSNSTSDSFITINDEDSNVTGITPAMFNSSLYNSELNKKSVKNLVNSKVANYLESLNFDHLTLPITNMRYCIIQKKVGIRISYELIDSASGELLLACVSIPSSFHVSSSNSKESNNKSTTKYLLTNVKNSHILSLELLLKLPYVGLIIPLPQRSWSERRYLVEKHDGKQLALIDLKPPLWSNNPVAFSCILYPTHGITANNQQYKVHLGPSTKKEKEKKFKFSMFSCMTENNLACFEESNMGCFASNTNTNKNYNEPTPLNSSMVSTLGNNSEIENSISYGYAPLTNLEENDLTDNPTSNSISSPKSPIYSKTSGAQLEFMTSVKTAYLSRNNDNNNNNNRKELIEGINESSIKMHNNNFSETSSSLNIYNSSSLYSIANPVKIITKKPIWNEELKAWTHYFGGRIRKASPKNFLALSVPVNDDSSFNTIPLDLPCPNSAEEFSEGERLVIRHGMLSDDSYILDFRGPISPAIALALSCCSQI